MTEKLLSTHLFSAGPQSMLESTPELSVAKKHKLWWKIDLYDKKWVRGGYVLTFVITHLPFRNSVTYKVHNVDARPDKTVVIDKCCLFIITALNLVIIAHRKKFLSSRPVLLF